MLDGGFDSFGTGFHHIHALIIVANALLDAAHAIIQLFRGVGGFHQNMNLAQQSCDDCPADNRKRQAYIRQREDAVTRGAPNGCVQKEQDKSHMVSTQYNPSTLTDRPNWLTNCMEMKEFAECGNPVTSPLPTCHTPYEAQHGSHSAHGQAAS